MYEISKKVLNQFLIEHNNLHDYTITGISYSIRYAKIELILSNKKNKLRIVFEGVEKYKCEEIFDWNHIDDVYLKYLKLGSKELLCFASEKEKPFIFIVANKMKYENIKPDKLRF